jgi:hypothetical protein
MKPVSYQDITPAGATSRDVSANKKYVEAVRLRRFVFVETSRDVVSTTVISRYFRVS